jgi:cobyric acid synthase
MWALLTELSRQIAWDGEHLTESEWKDLLTACLRKQKVVRGIEGGLVFLGSRTSNMSKREMADLIELIYAFAAERGVILGTVDA